MLAYPMLQYLVISQNLLSILPINHLPRSAEIKETLFQFLALLWHLTVLSNIYTLTNSYLTEINLVKCIYRKGVQFFTLALLLIGSTSIAANDALEESNNYRIVKETGDLFSNFKLSQIKVAALKEAQNICKQMAAELVIEREIPTSKSTNHPRAKYELIYKCV